MTWSFGGVYVKYHPDEGGGTHALVVEWLRKFVYNTTQNERL